MSDGQSRHDCLGDGRVAKRGCRIDAGRGCSTCRYTLPLVLASNPCASAEGDGEAVRPDFGELSWMPRLSGRAAPRGRHALTVTPSVGGHSGAVKLSARLWSPWTSAPSGVRLASAVRGLLGIGVIGIVVIAVGGCGGGSSSLAAGLKPYLVQGNEETGYAIQRPLERYKTAAGYAASEQNPAAAQQLTRAGFQQALVENTGGGNGVSFVLQFATASDAAREQSFELQNDLATQGGQPFRFSVPGVTGTDGFGARPVAGQGDANVLFREGQCLLLVGDESSPHPKSYEAAVVAGVQAIYARTAGHHGACSG